MTLRIHNRHACRHPGCQGLLEALDDHCPVCGRIQALPPSTRGAWANVQQQLPLRAGRRHRRAT
jgi:hypothetical protein